jgi:A/G-specific adenine glycosylase
MYTIGADVDQGDGRTTNTLDDQTTRMARPSERTLDIARRIRLALLRWYGKNRRDLPWRGTRDPYRIWVAEVILQQTQVSRGVEYYEQFLRRFPNVTALARADLDDVLHAWAGLGYYARARNLHVAARDVADRHGGHMPSTYSDLRSLPGVGEYTANAILSMAFDQAVAAVDANAVRVIARLLAIRTEPQRAPAGSTIDSFAQALVARGRAREINQAVMDLGATICLPRSPRCEQCPVARHCRAFASSRQDQIPVRPRRKRPRTYPVGVALIERDGAVLLIRRADRPTLGGLWELPGARCKVGESIQECVRRAVRETVGCTVRIGRKVLMMPYSISGAHLRVHVFGCRLRGEAKEQGDGAEWRWVSWESAPRDYGLSTAVRRLLEQLRR